MRFALCLPLLWVGLAFGCGDQRESGSSSGGKSSGGAPVASGGATQGGATQGLGGSVIAGESSQGGDAQSGADAGGAGGAPVTSSGGSVAMGGSGPDLSAELYDPERVPHFELELPKESVDALTADPDTYVRGSLKYGSERVDDIGVRIKGEGSRRTLAQKAALKLKFDEFVDKQSFRGLRRLTLNNMVEDPSFLAERLAYHVFRAAKLPAPRCNNALVTINGQAYGVYANVETEDKTFLRRWFTSDDGNLYEEGQKDFVPGAETAFDLETNETANDRSHLAELIDLLQSATSENFLEHVGQALDMEHFLRFTAAEAAVNQWDMYAYTVFYPNNFRLYDDPTKERFVFLPWGMDMSMKPFRDSGKPHIQVFTLARQGDARFGKITAGLLFQRCVESAPCKAKLSQELASVADVYEGLGLEALAQRYHAQIADHVQADPRKEYTA
ncbi:MAG TPA: CotH kinase family protein, partial [Polyangiales bacterium]|nr:CotH kinase family protein [Polyangiales bacterium]